jgi:hypothetical protein
MLCIIPRPWQTQVKLNRVHPQGCNKLLMILSFLAS